jgi:lipoprotein-anchoring transpeptidase ErfK/SrfK
VILLVYGALLLFSRKTDGCLLPVKPGDSGVDHGIAWEAHILKEGENHHTLFRDLAKDAIRFNRKASQFWKPGAVIRKPVDGQVEALKGWTPMPPTCNDCPRTKKRCIVISLSSQFLGVYKKGFLKASYPVSTGIPDYETPVGKYKVLSSSPSANVKFKKIFSFTYRVWMRWPLSIGHEIYIHAGDLPGYPASHGCVRLMRRDAFKLFRNTPISTPVVIVD